jgi:hypothetical protein
VSVKERKASKKAQEASRKESVEKAAALYEAQQASARERRLLKKIDRPAGKTNPTCPRKKKNGEASEKNSVKEEEEDSMTSSHPSPTPEGSDDDEPLLGEIREIADHKTVRRIHEQLLLGSRQQ